MHFSKGLVLTGDNHVTVHSGTLNFSIWYGLIASLEITFILSSQDYK